ncbi:ABC transporter permease [Gammaproteobacteria bacterium]|nr:ABC transporter permease [Gammaproteobacteria bacterium]
MKNNFNILNALQLALFEARRKTLDTYFGWVWSVISPIMTILIYLFVLVYIFKSPQENIVLWLVSGIAIWIYISNSLIKTSSTIVNKKAIIHHQYVHQKQLIFAELIAEFFVFIPILIGAFIIAAFSGSLSLNMFLIIYLFATLIAFLFGMGLFFSTLTVFIRDIPHLLTVFLQITFWLTPIVYSKGALPPAIASLISLNPFSYFVELSQIIFLNYQITTSALVIPFILAALSLILGNYIHNKLKSSIAIYL